jgi:hypothetical protein
MGGGEVRGNKMGGSPTRVKDKGGRNILGGRGGRNT